MLTAGDGPDPTSPTGAGRVLSLIRDGEAVTRADLARRTGLARSTVAQRVEALLAHQLVYEAGGSASTGGRPPTVLAFNRSAGVVLVADLGATHSRLAVTDLGGTPLAERAFDTDVARGPEIVLAWVHERFDELLAVVERDRDGRARHRRRRARRRSRSRAASRSRRRSCPAGTASRSRTGSRSTTTRRCSSTTT